MSFEPIRYGQLHDYLASLGYRAEAAPTHVVYRKSGRRLPVVLPKTSRGEEVPQSHLAAVGRILELDGIILTGQFAVPVDRVPPRRRAAKAGGTTAKAAKADGTNGTAKARDGKAAKIRKPESGR
jgi:hypothetical protein